VLKKRKIDKLRHISFNCEMQDYDAKLLNFQLS